MTIDSLHRPLQSLRLSVTDRCNLRCAYCMREAKYDWLTRTELRALARAAGPVFGGVLE